MNDAFLQDSFSDLLTTQALEGLWGGHRDSLLFALLRRARLRVFDPRLEGLVAGLQDLVAREDGAGAVLSFPVHIHGSCAPHALSDAEDAAARDGGAAHVFVLSAHTPWGEVLQNRTGFLKATHRLWVEGGDDVAFLIFVPRVFGASADLAFSGFGADKAEAIPSHRRVKIETEGLYACEASFACPAPQTVLFRVRQLWPAFPLVVRGLVFDTQTQRVTPYSSVAKDGWAYHLHPYADRVPVSMTRYGDLYRLAFCVRLGAGAELFMDVTPEWSLAFQDLPVAQPVLALDVREVSCRALDV